MAIIITITLGNATTSPIKISIAKIISITLATSKLATKTSPFTNKNKANIKTIPPRNSTWKIPYTQNNIPTARSNEPNILTIMIF